MMAMDLELQRQPTNDYCTFGSLFMDGAFFCYTLEPSEHSQFPDIPMGTYTVQINYSVRFKRLLPLVMGVPGRLGIRIHPGNTEKDTDGCILLGTGRTPTSVTDSRTACERFQQMIAQPLSRQEVVRLTIRNAPAIEMKA